MTEFRWLVIGTGRIATTVMREITKTGRHSVSAVFSRTKNKAQKFADRFGAEVEINIDSALKRKDIDGVYIATPHSVHYQYLIKCIDAGVPVLCEKAFTVNREQAKAVLDRAEEKDVYVLEGMWTRFNPVIRQICDWVKSGKIGDIKFISANFCLPVKIAKPFMSDRVWKPEYAGGALLDLGVYPIAYAHMLLGNPSFLTCTARLEDGVDYDDSIVLKYENPEATCRLNCSFDGLKTYRSKIVGTKGYIKSNMFYKPTRATLFADGNRETVRCKRGYIYEFDAFASDVREGKKQNEFMPHSATLDVMAMLDLCRAQNHFEYPENIEKI